MDTELAFATLQSRITELERENEAMRHDLATTDGLYAADNADGREPSQIRHASIMPKPERLDYLKAHDAADFVPYRPEQRDHIGYAGVWRDRQGDALAFEDFEGGLFFDF